MAVVPLFNDAFKPRRTFAALPLDGEVPPGDVALMRPCTVVVWLRAVVCVAFSLPGVVVVVNSQVLFDRLLRHNETCTSGRAAPRSRGRLGGVATLEGGGTEWARLLITFLHMTNPLPIEYEGRTHVTGIGNRGLIYQTKHEASSRLRGSAWIHSLPTTCSPCSWRARHFFMAFGQ